jgi:2',3'-cyclic-nucleotide 2'-phosphodiesterase (5'-nucleotidase family)
MTLLKPGQVISDFYDLIIRDMLMFDTIKGIPLRRKQVMEILLLIVILLSGCHSLRLTRFESANIRIDSTLNISPDPKIESVILPYRMRLKEDMGEVLCQSAAPLFGGRPESLLTNFCADLVLQESDTICLKQYPGIRMSVSMVNRGGLRVPIPKGEVKVQDMFELMPFENEVIFLKLSGVELRRFINHIALRGGEGVSGMRFGIKDEKAIGPEIKGQPLDDSKSYWLATSDYIANGGDGSEILKGVKERIATGVKFRDMFIGYLRKLGKKGLMIEAKTDGRIYDAK